MVETSEPGRPLYCGDLRMVIDWELSHVEVFWTFCSGK